MKHRRAGLAGRGFTLVELMVGLAVLVILLAIATPSFNQLIAQERLKSINAELVTSLQYARTEAVARNTVVQIKFQATASMSCYVVYAPTLGPNCDCTRTPGSACISPTATELHTIQIPVSTDVQVRKTSPGSSILVLNADGLVSAGTTFTLTTSRISGATGTLQTTVNPMGRPTVCSPGGSVPGAQPC